MALRRGSEASRSAYSENQATEELGLEMDNANESMSDIGGVVAGEASMDFSTELNAPMEGVRRKARGGGWADNISMSRFAESYWKSPESSGAQTDLVMEFATDTDNHNNGGADELAAHEQTEGDSFLERANNMLLGSSQRTRESFHSNDHYGASSTEPQPVSYHEFPTEDRLPTFSSPKPLNTRVSALSLDLERPPLLAADSGSTVNDGIDHRFARLVARYSDEPSASSDVTMDMPGSPELHTRYSSPQDNWAAVVHADNVDAENARRVRAFLAKSKSAVDVSQDTRVGHRTYARSYQAGYSLDRSAESLEHPNMGSQRSESHYSMASAANRRPPSGHLEPLGDFGTDDFGADDFGADGFGADDFGADDFGADMINSFGSPTGDEPHEAPDSSNPDLSDILRDHERVFSDLFDHSTAFARERPPESLFASSSSIVAEIGRHRRVLSTWDGREATADALLLQEQNNRRGPNPIEMLEKTNSLGMAEDQSDVSGLLPESEYSPSVHEAHAWRGRGHSHARAPARASPDAPPPTTPTTFISRDTRHGPSTRVLHQVPFEQVLSHVRPATGLGLAKKRPLGPRALDSMRPPMLSIANAYNIHADNASETSSNGLGSLFQDTLEISRIAGTPAKAVGAQRAGWLTPSSNYVPFQEPTVDISRLPNYRDINVGSSPTRQPHAQPTHAPPAQQPRGRSTLESPARLSRARSTLESPTRQSNTARSTLGSSAVATLRCDSTPPNAEGPTLRDIYELLQKTASSLDGKQKSSGDAHDRPVASFAAPRRIGSSEHGRLPTDAQPAAAAHTSSPGPYAASHRPAVSPAPQRDGSDRVPPMLYPSRPSAPTPRRSKRFPRISEADEGAWGQRPGSSVAASAQPGTEPTKGALRELQRELLARFDECRAEVGRLRAEVQGNSAGDPLAQWLGATDAATANAGSDGRLSAAGLEAGDDALSETSTVQPLVMRSPMGPMLSPANKPGRRGLGRASPRAGDLLETRELLDSVRRRSARHSPLRDDENLYGREMARQLAETLAELQRVHIVHYHSAKQHAPCPVCATLEAQHHDPYLFGRNAVAYRSMTTRQLQGLLNAYVAAMETEFPNCSKKPLDLAGVQQPSTAYHSFTPTRKHKKSSLPAKDKANVVLELLREELDALSRRYDKMVREFHRLDPSDTEHQRRRRQMTRELKDLVDLLDVKGEQIAMLAALHPPAKKTPAKGAERAYQSARALQQALGEIY
ncbi:hypothetical protein BX070DRAFT_65454 [Coemansia spiralis]|nr:hypothetical protein BX070DRAFT_65454 [Coemansia spiralis]